MSSYKLIRSFLTAGVLEEGNLKKVTTGTPQGGIISPLLANLYLTELDRAMEAAGLRMVRYADDFVILCTSVNQATYAFKKMKEKLGRLKLSLAEEKTQITTVRKGFSFLGYTFWKRNDTLYLFPSDASIERYKEKVRQITKRQQPRNLTMLIERLNPIIRGWGNYFARRGLVGNAPGEVREILERLRQYGGERAVKAVQGVVRQALWRSEGVLLGTLKSSPGNSLT